VASAAKSWDLRRPCTRLEQGKKRLLRSAVGLRREYDFIYWAQFRSTAVGGGEREARSSLLGCIIFGYGLPGLVGERSIPVSFFAFFIQGTVCGSGLRAGTA
jgi:hypothetical protein